MSKAGGKIWQRAQANKKRIYFSAMRLFAAHGYDNVSIDDIVREAGSSKGTFYNYFKGKDELFFFYNQSLDERLKEFYQRLLGNKHYSGQDYLDKLYIMIMYTLHMLAESGREFTAISDIRQLREEGDAAPTEDVLCNTVLHIFHALIEQGKHEGSIDRAIDGNRAELLLYFYLKGIVYEWESRAQNSDLLVDAAPAIQLFCNSIAGR